jgi:hypothetical protein
MMHFFTADGARVPTFRQRIVTEAAVRTELRVGYRTAQTWAPAYVAERWEKRHWWLWSTDRVTLWVPGSMSAASVASRISKNAVFPLKRWPNLASIEMYLRMVRP